MARNGICTNYGNCSVADAGTPVLRGDSESFECPGCGRPLKDAGAPPQLTPIARRNLLIGGGAVGGVAAVGALWFLLSPHGGANPGKGGGPASVPGGELGDTLLVLSGSNTIGSKLGPALVKAFLEKKQYAGAVIEDGNHEEIDVTVHDGSGHPAHVHVSAHGSGDAFKDLASGKADIGMASRPIKPDEAKSLAALGDLTDETCEHVIGLDGIAIIVNPANPLTQLTLAQLKDIYLGNITDWSALGGRAGTIKLYARKAPSGTLDFFKERVLDKADIVGANSIEDSSELSAAVSKDPNGIGFIGTPYILAAKALAIADGTGTDTRFVMPGYDLVKSEIYPITRRLYLYTPARPPKALVPEFVAFAQSPAGQEIVAAQGFVRYDLELPAPETSHMDYGGLNANAQLFQTFYFRSGDARPDNLSLTRLDGFKASLDALNVDPSRLMLFGFADGRGNPASNMKLSWDRVSGIAAELAQRQVPVSRIQGLGGAYFIVSNATREGAQRNRRVEVWIARN